jgi:uncharacterized protein
MDMMMKPKLFSSSILASLTELYTTLEEIGDTPKPRLVFVIDEAHFLFENMNTSTLEQVEMILRLIRSK